MKRWISSLLAIAVAGCATQSVIAEPEAVVAPSEMAALSEDAMISDIVARMTLEQKVAQLIQPQINSFTAEDMERYRFGSYLNGGNGGPYGDELAPAPEWLRLADEMWNASTRPLPNGEPVIPAMWGTDAVHGHTNVVGATIFPHNIALGATGDTDLVRRIGAATALEIEVTGIDWNFSPTVAVARDDRWGRTYESYSEDPRLVAKMGAALVEGLQGRRGDPDFLGTGHVISTAKHFFGDGGTAQGVDQGDVNGDLEALKSIHVVPYPSVIDAGVQAIMASFNSINGRKMHGNKALLTDLLRGELGFNGLVVGDWNGHAQVAGCEVDDCPQSLLAGLDVYMVPDDWKSLLENIVADVEDGTIPMARVDEAVTRVLRVKHRAGLLGPDARKPSARPHAGEWSKLGSPSHRALAREAVAKSQVVLKNDGILPLTPSTNVLVAGTAADSIAQASGGWTLTWQGGGELTNEVFPGATSIWDGFTQMAEEERIRSAVLSPDGSYDERPDIAVVVFGEEPYAEFAGDLKDAVLRDEDGLRLLRQFKADGVPTVAVFLSGRPLWVNREINAANAFVASWLPGSEGGGVADVLTGARPATGRLSFSWPASCMGEPVNSTEGALFPLGYGNDLGAPKSLGALSEECALLTTLETTDWFVAGRLGGGVTVSAFVPEADSRITEPLEQFRGSGLGVTARGIDRNAQEDAREIHMEPNTAFGIASPLDQKLGIRIVYKVEERPRAPVNLSFGLYDAPGSGVTLDITQALSIAEGKGWRELLITEECAPEGGQGFGIISEGELTFQIAAITREKFPEGTECNI